MRVLLLGAYGYIGSAIAHELIARGHEVTGLGRDIAYGRRILPKLQWVQADLIQMATAETWLPLLEGMDAVINASGLLQGGDGGTVEAVQLRAIRTLVEACEAASIERLVQISAAGADTGASSEFMTTKAKADAIVAGSRIRSLIIRPGLVIGRNSFGGTELLRTAAAVPARLHFTFEASIQCVALSDVVEAAANALEPNGPAGQHDLVERERRSLDAIIASHRQWLGFPEPSRSVRIPAWTLALVSGLSDLLGPLGWRSPLRRNALLALEAGVRGDSREAAELLGREPLSLESMLAMQPAGKQDRLHARMALVQPLIIASLFVMWAGSGLATLCRLDHATAIVEAGGVSPGFARVIAIAGAWLDVVLAVGLMWRRTVRASLLAMVLLTVFIYLLGGTILLPGLWLDPLAPLAKAVPATMMALIAFWLVEKR